jgi:hypothetical protein
VIGHKLKSVESDRMRFGALAAHAHAACTPVRKTRKVARRVTQRRKLPGRIFAIPESRKFPIHDAYHANLALGHLMRMVGRHGLHAEYKSDEARKVLSAVRKHWPSVYACEADLVRRIKKEYRLS